jgi:hypothetical protein
MKTFARLLFVIAVGCSGCSTLTLAPVDYSWPIEIRPVTDGSGFIRDDRAGIALNVKPLFFAETKDSLATAGIPMRMIRDAGGYYYMTAPQFKNVYVFCAGDGKMKLETIIPVSEAGLQTPGFNQRAPFIQLVNGKDKPIMLTKNGKQEGDSK